MSIMVHIKNLRIKCKGTNPRAIRSKVPHRLSYNQHFLRSRETQHGREFAGVKIKLDNAETLCFNVAETLTTAH